MAKFPWSRQKKSEHLHMGTNPFTTLVLKQLNLSSIYTNNYRWVSIPYRFDDNKIKFHPP
jgi:hypothetical protein